MVLKPNKYDYGLADRLDLAQNQTIVKGDTLGWNGSGYLEAGSKADESSDYVALESVITTSAESTILVAPAFHSGIRFVADFSIAMLVAQQGIAYELSTKSVIDNEATASADGFVLEKVLYPLSDKKGIGYWR